MRIISTLSVFCLSLSLTACSGGWFGGEESDTPLPGNRVSALEYREGVKQDEALTSMKVVLPPVYPNTVWTDQASAPVANPAWTGTGDVSTASAVTGADDNKRLTSSPVIGQGLVFTLGDEGEISARRQANISEEVWEYTITAAHEEDDVLGVGIVMGSTAKEFLGGNIAYGEGMVVATTRRGDVVALDAATGELRWQRNVKLPVKSAPVLKEGRLFLITTDNRLYGLEAATGETLWIHAGIAETTSMFGAPSPAATGNTVVVPYSSGEVHALDARKGNIMWSDILVNTLARRPSSIVLSSNSTPAISGGKVYVASYDGVLAAIELGTGNRLWTQDIGGLYSPWVSGDFLFMVTSDNQLVCIHANTGGIKWIQPLQGEEGEHTRWSAPIVAGDKVVLAGSNGKLYSYNPQDGSAISTISIPEDVMLPPVVAGGTLYVLSNNGTLAAVK